MIKLKKFCGIKSQSFFNQGKEYAWVKPFSWQDLSQSFFNQGKDYGTTALDWALMWSQSFFNQGKAEI